MTGRFIKFCAVGASGFFVNMAVFSVLEDWGCYYVTAAVLSFLAAVSNNFFWNYIWTFKDRRYASSGLRNHYLKFVCISAACLLGNLVILVFLAEKIGLTHNLSQITAILAMSAVNFAGQNIFTFNAKKEEKTATLS